MSIALPSAAPKASWPAALTPGGREALALDGVDLAGLATARGTPPRVIRETGSTRFHGFPRPEVVLVDRGRHVVVKRRETLDEIRSRDIMPADRPAPGTGGTR